MPVDAFASVVGGRRCGPGGATPLGLLRRALTSPDPTPYVLRAGFSPVAFGVSGLASPRVLPKAVVTARPEVAVQYTMVYILLLLVKAATKNKK